MSNEMQEFTRNIVRHISHLERQRKRYLDDHLQESKLYGSMFMIILFLDRNPGSSQDSLCDYLLIDKSGVARKCRILEDLRYIKREQSPNNRRQNKLYLTEGGQKLLPIIRSHLSDWCGIVTRGMQEHEQKELIRLLALMEKNALTI